MVACPDLHRLERVVEVGVAQFVGANRERVVGGNRDEFDPLGGVFGLELRQAGFIGVGGRTVVAGEHDHQGLGVGEVGERVRLAVDPREAEVGRRLADRQRFGIGRPAVVGPADRGQEDCRKTDPIVPELPHLGRPFAKVALIELAK